MKLEDLPIDTARAIVYEMCLAAGGGPSAVVAWQTASNTSIQDILTRIVRVGAGYDKREDFCLQLIVTAYELE